MTDRVYTYSDVTNAMASLHSSRLPQTQTRASPSLVQSIHQPATTYAPTSSVHQNDMKNLMASLHSSPRPLTQTRASPSLIHSHHHHHATTTYAPPPLVYQPTKSYVPPPLVHHD